MSVEQATRPPAYQILADDLRAQITSGRLRPGERLPAEPQLCARSGVSRSTVREALRLLSSQHLIVTTRGVTGGSFVAHPNPSKLADSLSSAVELLLNTATVGAAELLELRETLEVPATRFAAERRTDEHLAALRSTLFEPATDRVPAMIQAHRAFHAVVAAATGNPLYELSTQPLYQLSNGREMAEAAPTSFWGRMDADHRQILARIADRDAAGAGEAARAHIAFLRSIFVEQD